MVLVRCEDHERPKGRTRKYIKSVQPVGYPNTAAICGRKGCNQPRLVWMEAHEWNKYQHNQRVFELPNAGAKVKVE